MARQRVTQAQAIEALRKTGGLIYLAAQILRVTRQTLYNMTQRYPRLLQVVAEERELLVDLAEHGLKAKVLEGESWAIQFTLKTLGKDRGYLENPRLALEHSGAIAVEAVSSWKDVEKLGLSRQEVIGEALRLIEAATDEVGEVGDEIWGQ